MSSFPISWTCVRGSLIRDPPPRQQWLSGGGGGGGGGGAKFVAVANVCCALSLTNVRFALVRRLAATPERARALRRKGDDFHLGVLRDVEVCAVRSSGSRRLRSVC